MKKYPIRFLSFLIFVGFLFVGLPLHPIKAALTVNYLTDQDGLPNYTVYKIFKDSRNMMWIGTFNGICRFDGHSFTKFHIDLPKPLNAVTDIVETHEGHIMFGTRKGLYLVEPERQTCVQVCPQISFVNCIGKIGQTLLIGSANGLWVYKNPEEAEPIKFENSVISKGNIVNDITDDGKGGAWLCSDEFLIHLNLKDRSLKKYKISKDLLTGNLRNICRGGDRIYIGTRNSGLLVFDPSTASTESYIDLDCPVIADLNSDGKDLLYVATDGNGAYIIDTRKRQIVNTYRTNTADFPLPSNAVYTFWHDKTLGISWFGFATDGICYNYHRHPLFKIYRYKDLNTDGLPVRSFCIHDGDKAIGTQDGLWFVSEKRDIIRYFTSEEIGGRIVTNIQYFGGHFVIATYEKGLSILDPKTLELRHLDYNDNLKNGNFSRIEPLQDQRLFACSNTGIFVFDTDFNIVKHFHSRNSELPNAYICDILFDLTGKGWIGTMYSLAIYDPLTQTIQSRDFPEGFFDKESNLTFNLCRNGDMLAVSETSVFRSKSDLSEYTTLDLYQRLNIGNIFFITENRQGKYWMGTDKGLFLFEKDLKNYCQFNENDNLPSLRFNRNEFQETPDGVFWLGNTKGLMYLTPQMQTDLNRKIYGKVALNHMTIANREVQPQDFQRQLEQQEISLSWNFGCQTLSVVPILLNYAKPQGRYYEWSLDGAEYRSSRDGETISPDKLSLGSHNLKIRLAGHEETATTWRISVSPSLIFYIETLLAVLLVFFAWYTKALKDKRIRFRNLLVRKHTMDLEIAARRAIRKQKEEEEKKRQEAQEAKVQAMYEKSRMNQNEYKALHKKVKDCMENDKPYTNPNLRITDLAAMVDCTPTKLSQMFNQHLRQNFFDYVNLYRVEEFKRRVASEKYSQYTVVAISETCGFKRSTFFATFKKFEHCTPTEYLQQHGTGHPSKSKADTPSANETATD